MKNGVVNQIQKNQVESRTQEQQTPTDNQTELGDKNLEIKLEKANEAIPDSLQITFADTYWRSCEKKIVRRTNTELTQCLRYTNGKQEERSQKCRQCGWDIWTPDHKCPTKNGIRWICTEKDMSTEYWIQTLVKLSFKQLTTGNHKSDEEKQYPRTKLLSVVQKKRGTMESIF